MEIPPPAASWDRIVSELDNERSEAERRLSSKLLGLELEPPQTAMRNIFMELRPSRAEQGGWRKLAIAALVIGIVAVSALLMMQQQGTNAPLAPGMKGSVATTLPENSTANNETLAAIPSPSPAIVKFSSRINSRRIARKISAPPTVQSSIFHFAENIRPVSYADPDDVQIVPAARGIAVAAPPIRDGNGSIIMDLNLISDSNGDYILVTSPGGQQTRLSKKFVHFLQHLNSSAYTQSSAIEGAEWTSRFEEWRNLLLQNAFVPSATNFMDIFELKELIQER